MGLLSMPTLSHQAVDRREPAVSIHARAINHAEEFLLQPLGDGGPEAGADGDPVDRADRRNFGGRPAEENLVGDVQQFARNDALHYRDARFPGQREDGVARDAGKDASAPLLRGLLGLETDATDRKIVFAPPLPADWQTAGVHGIPLPGARVKLDIRRDASTLQ